MERISFNKKYVAYNYAGILLDDDVNIVINDRRNMRRVANNLESFCEKENIAFNFEIKDLWIGMIMQ